MKYPRTCAWIVLACTAALSFAQADFIPAKPLAEANLDKFWQVQLPLTDDQQIRDLYLVQNQLYACTQDGWVYAVHAPTGAVRWLRPITRSGYQVRQPAQVGDHVVFVTPTDLQVYHVRHGEPVRRTDLRFPPSTGAMTDGVRLFVGSVNHRLYTLEANTHFVDWKLLTDGPISSLPATYSDPVDPRNEWIFIANDAGTIYACTRENKRRHWIASTYGRVSADLKVTEQGVYAASRDQSLYLFDLFYGQVRWRARFSGPLYEAPVIATRIDAGVTIPETAYQFCPDDGLAAVDTGRPDEVEERLRWTIPHGRLALTVHEDHVYALSRRESLLNINALTGEILHTIPTPGFKIAAPALRHASIFLATPDGKLFCARPAGAPLPTREDLLEAILPGSTDDEEVTPPGDEVTTTQPATDIEELLRTKRRGIPIGGKSKVTKEIQEREKSP